MTFFQNYVFMEGSKEKLQRFVQRTNGKMSDGQRFYVDVKDKKLKQHRAFPFRFYCRFQKVDKGYEIRYFIMPTIFGVVRLGAAVVFLFLLLCQNKVNPYLAGGCFMILYFFNLFAQRAQCVRQFVAEFGK